MLVQPDHLQPGPVDEERDAFQVAHADEVGAVLDQRDELLPVGLGPLAVGDVGPGRGQEQDPARLVLDRQDGDVHHPLAAVGDEVGHLRPERLARRRLADAALIRSHQCRRGRPPRTFPKLLADDLLPRVAAAFPGQPVRFEDGAVHVHDPGEQRPLLEEGPELGVRRRRFRQQPPLPLLGLPLRGDVPHDLGRPDDPARLVLDGRDGQRNQDGLAVGSQAHGFEVFDPLPGLQGGDDPVLLGDAVGGMTREM